MTFIRLVKATIFCGLFVSKSLFSQDFTKEHAQWLKLLRYEKTLLGAYKSEVDFPDYFFSKQGKTNPRAELSQSIKAFKKDFSLYSDINKHPICLFPGRYLYLRSKNLVPVIDLSICEEFSEFKAKIDLDSVSLIFSSYYINKPASAFGHTLLKLNKKGAKNSDLESYAIDYSAQVTTKNPFLYGLYGIIGGFFGSFRLTPYFLKLREYNDYESRDLWEFKLNFSKQEKELFIAHLWDMNLALFNYYYFTENCSYHIYRFIDAIKPGEKLLQKLYQITIPIDTIIPIVKNNNILDSTYLRPSNKKLIDKQLSLLSSGEKNILKKALSKLSLPIKLETLSLTSKLETLDALIASLDYLYPNEILIDDKNNKVKDFKLKVLIARSKIAMPSPEVQKKIKINNFDYGHKARQLSLGYDYYKNSSFISFSNRSSLHNILERKGDFFGSFSLEMGKFQFGYNIKKKKFVFNDFQLINVLALRPINLLEKKISWSFQVGTQSISKKYTDLGPYAHLGLGYSFKLNQHLLFAMLKLEANHILRGDKSQNSAAPRVELYSRFNKRVLHSLSAEYVNDLKGIFASQINYQSQLSISYKYFQILIDNQYLKNSFKHGVRASIYY